jgi:hypothetical protein
VEQVAGRQREGKSAPGRARVDKAKAMEGTSGPGGAGAEGLPA